MQLQDVIEKLDMYEPTRSDSLLDKVIHPQADKVKFYTGNVGGDNKITAGEAMRTLLGYFGKPKKQEDDYLPNTYGEPAIPELRLVEEACEMRKLKHMGRWNTFFGAKGLVILPGQLAFLKEQENIIQIAIYRPYQDTCNDDASINIYELNKKDFGWFSNI